LVFAAVALGGWTNNGESGNSLAANTKAGAGDASLAPHVANCTSCHTAPDFTDRSFHNNGASQVEYDSVHGAGSFATLEIPPLEERNQQPNRYLPATSQHPAATGTFRSVAESDNPNAADLGMWNVFANPDFPEPQAALRKLMCGSNKCDLKDQLPQTIALFRTPSLRDLEDSSPFMHTGRFDAIEDVLRYYIRTSALARQGELRNGAPQLSGITIDEQDIKPLAAFLRSLNEDYD
jgi:cytochrome c peroxidase